MGSLSFLTPAAALVALAGLVPLATFLLRERRARAVRAALGLVEPPQGPGRALLGSLVAIPVLTGVAAAQPVLDRSSPREERTDAELFFVLDTSRSMLAAPGPDAPTRFDRARDAALELRARFPQVRAGVASVTDRTLPHLFPTIGGLSFRATLTRSLGIQRPPPSSFATVATDLGGLAAVGRQGFFTPSARTRVLIVLTDGETEDVGPGVGTALRRHRVRTLFVHLWRPGESVYVTSAPEPQYRPDPASRLKLARVAETVGGTVVPEDDLQGAGDFLRTQLGRGPTRERRQRDLLALMPWATAAAAFPLVLVLRRRNF
jgi:Mg-chelatase subunit ChlD